MQGKIIDRVDISYIVIPVKQWFGKALSSCERFRYCNGNAMSGIARVTSCVVTCGNGIVRSCLVEQRYRAV